MTQIRKIILGIFCLVLVFLLVMIAIQFDDIIYYFNYKSGRHLINPDGTFTLIIGDSMDLIETYATTPLARARFLGMKRHLSEKRRAEYIFEIIEWLNTEQGNSQSADTTKKRVSLYSEAYPLKWWSRAEMKFHKIGFDFEENKEYVIFVYSYDDMLVFNTGHYFCLEDVKNFHYSDRNEFAYLEKRGITAEMTADEIVARLKELIAEKKALKDAQ